MKNKAMLILTLVVVILALSPPPLLLSRGNPLPSDYNYETIPLSSNYNNSVYFKSEDIIFRFSSSRVYINANYTFENEKSTIVSINILLPFIISKSNEAKPPLLESLMLDRTELEYTWETIQIPSVSTSADFQAIEFTLNFNGKEEHTINIQYNRDYIDGVGSFSSRTEHYNFQYCVGTALAWNHNISTADFEFWIPKNICDEINSDRYFDSFEETDNYFIGNLGFTNWLPEKELISIWWTNEVLFTRVEQILMLYGVVILGILIGTTGLVFFLVRKYKRR